MILIFIDVAFQFLTSDVVEFDATTPSQICQLTVETIILTEMWIMKRSEKWIENWIEKLIQMYSNGSSEHHSNVNCHQMIALTSKLKYN